MSSLSSLIISDTIIITSIGFTATALGNFLGRVVNILQPTDFKRFVFNTLAISLSGVVGRELSLNTVERRNNNKKPLIRYASLTLGVAGMTAALIQKIGFFRFNWTVSLFKENVFSVILTAGSLCFFDHYVLFPIKKNEVTQEEVDQSSKFIRDRVTNIDEYEIDVVPLFGGIINVIKKYSADMISSNRIGMENVEVELKEGYLKLKKQINIANRYGIQINLEEASRVIQYAESALEL
jgi:hypothetical protein